MIYFLPSVYDDVRTVQNRERASPALGDIKYHTSARPLKSQAGSQWATLQAHSTLQAGLIKG